MRERELWGGEAREEPQTMNGNLGQETAVANMAKVYRGLRSWRKGNQPSP